MTKSLVCSAFTSTGWWILAVRKLRSSHGCGGLVLRVFFSFAGDVKVLSSFPVFFLATNYQWTKNFFKNWNQWRKIGKSEIGHFSGKNRNERQPDNLSGIENKDKSKAQLSLGLSRIVDVKKHFIWQGLLSPLSPHFMRAEAALGVDRRRGRRDTKHGTPLNLNLGSNEEDGAEWVQWQSLQSQITLVSLDLGWDRETVAGGERRGTDCESQLPVLGPCVASGNVTMTGLDRESEKNHLLSQYDIRTCCRTRLRGRTMLTAQQVFTRLRLAL